jgi:serine/threonine-protein kinase
LIGEGGMGAVYEGVQLRLNQRVAVKVMTRGQAAEPLALARFRREAEVTSQLGHPHIVHVTDFGVAPGGEPYLVMEFLEGEDLDRRLRRTERMAPANALHVVKQVASALSATHGKGIVHRDLKPANIFLLDVAGETDFVKVVDFGVSKVHAAATRLTRARVLMGTPSYMCPEQALGRTDEIDHRTDQWALACITWQMLSGRSPFAGDHVSSVLYQVVHESPEPLTPKVPGLPPEVETVLRRALSKPKDDRFPTIGAFSRALEAAFIGAGPVGDVTPPPVMVSQIWATSESEATPPPWVGGAAKAPTAGSPVPEKPAARPSTFTSSAGEATLSLRRPLPWSKRTLAIVGAAILALALIGLFLLRSGGAPSTAPARPLPPAPPVAPVVVQPPPAPPVAPAVEPPPIAKTKPASPKSPSAKSAREKPLPDGKHGKGSPSAARHKAQPASRVAPPSAKPKRRLIKDL